MVENTENSRRIPDRQIEHMLRAPGKQGYQKEKKSRKARKRGILILVYIHI